MTKKKHPLGSAFRDSTAAPNVPVLGPVYVASSWKNNHFLDHIHETLNASGISTLDFRAQGRWWSKDVKSEDFYGRCRTKAGISAFEYDFKLMQESVGAFVVLPAGEAVALEVGWFAGRGLPIVVWGEPRSPLDITWRVVKEANGILCPDLPLWTAVEHVENLLRGRVTREV